MRPLVRASLWSLGVLATTTYFAWWFAMAWLGSTAPQFLDVEHNRVYPYLYKRTVLFLTYREHLLTSEWFMLAVPVAMLSFGLLRRERERTSPPGPQPWLGGPGKS